MSKKTKIKAIIFDLDGTLLDSIEDIAIAVNKSLVDLGFNPHDTKLYKSFVGDGVEELVKRALPEEQRTEENIEKMVEKFNAFYENQWLVNTRPFPGVIYLIQFAFDRKVKLAILSNKPRYFTKKMIRFYFRSSMTGLARSPFGVYSGAGDGLPNKPDPAAALQLANRLKIKPENIAFIGDMPVDMITAKKAGMLPLGAGWGFSTESELKKAGAVKVFANSNELVKYLDELVV